MEDRRKEVFFTNTNTPAAIQKRSRTAHIAVSAVEALIRATMSGVFFTLLVKQMGVSDALTGILSNVIFLGCSMQVFSAAFVRRLPSLRIGTLVLHSVQHLLYSFLFLLPFLPMAGGLRVALFAGVYAVAALSANLVSPARFHWMMSMVEPEHRGIFTAHKEMIALVLTIVYNLGMGRVVDHFSAAGRPDIGLKLCAATILVLMAVDIISLLRSADAPAVLNSSESSVSLGAALRTNLRNPGFVKVAVMGFGWNVLCFFCNSYHNVFLLQELQCSTTFIVAAGMGANLIRLAMSVPMGRYADRNGFARLAALGFGLAAFATGILAFWRPAGGAVLYLIYQIPFSFSMAALTGTTMNILLPYVPPKDRVSAQGIYGAITGVSGFLGSVLGGALLAVIQTKGLTVFGVSVYAQQVLNLISALGMAALAVYVRTVLCRMPQVEE